MNSRAFCYLILMSAAASQACGQGEVVAYISHDEEHSRQIMELFEKETGIEVRDTYDTEDTKTVGLVKRIVGERKSPVCDVFWNNECGQSERLREEGLLQPYISPMARTIEARFKDPEGYWTGFAARSRVLVWNTEKAKEDELPRTLEDLAAPRFKGLLAIARPLTGTTLTHFAALYVVWGEEKADAWLDGLLANDVRWLSGNGPVAQEVAEGVVPFGLTDTDDVNGRRLDGYPIQAVYLDQGDGGLGSFVIPNAVMILKGAPHLSAAKKLVDFLLSPRVEKLLAEGRAAQIPLQPGVEVPAHVTPLGDGLRPMSVDFGKVGETIAARHADLEARFEKARGGAETGVLGLVWAMLALGLAVVFVWFAVKPRGGSSG